MVILASFWKSEACGQTVLPYRSVLIGKKMVENGKIQKFKCDILWVIFKQCEVEENFCMCCTPRKNREEQRSACAAVDVAAATNRTAPKTNSLNLENKPAG